MGPRFRTFALAILCIPCLAQSIPAKSSAPAMPPPKLAPAPATPSPAAAPLSIPSNSHLPAPTQAESQSSRAAAPVPSSTPATPSSVKKEDRKALEAKTKELQKEAEKAEQVVKAQQQLAAAQTRLRVAQERMKAFESNSQKSSGSGSGEENSYCKYDGDDEKKFIRVRRSVLAPKEASDAFGRRIGRRYIVFQLTVENRSSDYQYLIHDMSVDLSSLYGQRPGTYEYAFSSRELSILRGVPEKGQDLDPRNLSLRLLRGIGSVAGGISGLTSFDEAMGSSVAVFNGPLLSSFIDVAPDHTGTQLNRLSDSAYAANSIIPRQQSRVFAIFVPQSLFLSSGDQERFWKEPLDILSWLDFRQADVCIDGTFVTELADLSPMITAILFTSQESSKFQFGGSEIIGIMTGKNFSGKSISIEVTSPENLTAEANTVSGDQIEFKIKTAAPIPPNTPIKISLHKGDTLGQYTVSPIYKPQPPSITSLTVKAQTAKKVTLDVLGNAFLPGDTTLNIFGAGYVAKSVDAQGTGFEIEVDLPQDYDKTKAYKASVSSILSGTRSAEIAVPAIN